MAARRPVFTENFSNNLSEIEDFLGDDRAAEFSRLFEELEEEVVPNLCEFPTLGRSFLNRAILSSQALHRATRLADTLDPDNELRELIHREYLILYTDNGIEVGFLAIKHHRQLSFDLARFWVE